MTTFFAGDELAAADLNAVADFPLCKLVQQSGQTITNNTATALTFGSSSEEIKTHSSMHSTSSNTTRIVVPVDGIYEVTVKGYYAFSNTINYCDVSIALNDAIVGRSGNLQVGSANNVSHNAGFLSEPFAATASQYFTAIMFQVSTGSVSQTTNTGTGTACRFTVKWLRPLP